MATIESRSKQFEMTRMSYQDAEQRKFAFVSQNAEQLPEDDEIRTTTTTVFFLYS